MRFDDGAKGLYAEDASEEHVRHWFKERNWSKIYVVPLDPETPTAVVKAVEGRIGRRLKPVDNRRLPAPIFLQG